MCVPHSKEVNRTTIELVGGMGVGASKDEDFAVDLIHGARGI